MARPGGQAVLPAWHYFSQPLDDVATASDLWWPSSITEDIDKSGDIVGETGRGLLQTLSERWCIQEGVHSRRMLVALKQGGSIWSGHLTGCLLQAESIAEEFRAWYNFERLEPTGFHNYNFPQLQFEFTNRRIDTNRIKPPCFPWKKFFIFQVKREEISEEIIAKESRYLNFIKIFDFRQTASNLILFRLYKNNNSIKSLAHRFPFTRQNSAV